VTARMLSGPPGVRKLRPRRPHLGASGWLIPRSCDLRWGCEGPSGPRTQGEALAGEQGRARGQRPATAMRAIQSRRTVESPILGRGWGMLGPVRSSGLPAALAELQVATGPRADMCLSACTRQGDCQHAKRASKGRRWGMQGHVRLCPSGCSFRQPEALAASEATTGPRTDVGLIAHARLATSTRSHLAKRRTHLHMCLSACTRPLRGRVHPQDGRSLTSAPTRLPARDACIQSGFLAAREACISRQLVRLARARSAGACIPTHRRLAGECISAGASARSAGACIPTTDVAPDTGARSLPPRPCAGACEPTKPHAQRASADGFSPRKACIQPGLPARARCAGACIPTRLCIPTPLAPTASTKEPR